MKANFLSIYAFIQSISAIFPPGGHAGLERRATTTKTTSSARPPACTAGSDVVVNGAFYQYTPDFESFTYAPWNLSDKIGNPGCQYITSYDACVNFGTFGGDDPVCFSCEYGSAGGGDSISQQITFAPNCEYIVEASVGCYAHSATIYGQPHVYIQVSLDGTVVIPQQRACSCSSFSQSGCHNYPDPTYKIISGRIITPASGKGILKAHINQAPQATPLVAPLVLTSLRMITPGTDINI